MRKRIIVLFLVLFYAIGGSLFALGVSEYPIQHNVYGQLALALPRDYGACITVGAGYEGALNENWSLGGYLGMIAGGEIAGADLLFNVKYYIQNSALENFFIGANIGLSIFGEQNVTGTLVDFVVGLKAGYKFNFNSFTVEPFVGYDLLAGDGIGGRFNVGVALGYGWIPPPPPEPPEPPKGDDPPPPPRDGIYVGIVTFGPNAEAITSEPIYLDAAGLARINDLLDTKYQRDDSIGTALFYAAHLGLAEMKRNESKLPELKHVAMITLTDGLDVSSTGLSLRSVDDPGNTASFAGGDLSRYQNFVKGEIDNRRINGTGISAYIAVGGDDINSHVVRTASESLSSEINDEYIRSPNSTTELEAMYTEIAARVVSDLTISNFTVLTPEYPRGTRVRMTFNTEIDRQEAQSAQMYLEGEVTIRDGQYYLTNIVYNGISSSAGAQLRGERQRGAVLYEFQDFYGYDITRSEALLRRELRQWYMNTGETEWQYNIEYGMAPVSIPNKVRNNTLVYLILDKSPSVSFDIVEVRNATKRFVNLLYIYNQQENRQEQ